jgi:acetyltransferase-like isoleucine patch superfamily enzyme
MDNGIIRIRNKIQSALYYCTLYWYYRCIFASLGARSFIKSKGLRLENPKNIHIGKRVFIGNNTWLAASPHVASDPKLYIEDQVSIGRFNQIYSTTCITIQKNVLTADRVYISDSTHDSQDVSIPIKAQKVTSKGPLVIGEGTWIGINACIVGASIGKNCVVGANSVVTKNVPDYCIVGGIPAIILKRFNPLTGVWERTNKSGEFLMPNS